MITVRPSREAVARWNTAYAEQTAALFAAMRSETSDVAAVRRLARAYHQVAQAWLTLAADLGAPVWARHAAAVAGEQFALRADVEHFRADLIETQGEE